MNFEDLLDILHTKNDADVFCAYLEELWETYNKSTKDFKVLSRTILPVSWYEAVLEAGKKNDLDLSAKNQITQFISGMKEYVTQLPVVQLTVAIDLNSTSVEYIVDWLRRQLEQKVLLELHQDEAVVGGAIISFNGYYKDFSVGKAIEQYL